jgi:hypothetical protein
VLLREKYYSHAHIIHEKKGTMCKEQQALHPNFFYPHQRAMILEGMHLNFKRIVQK